MGTHAHLWFRGAGDSVPHAQHAITARGSDSLRVAGLVSVHSNAAYGRWMAADYRLPVPCACTQLPASYTALMKSCDDKRSEASVALCLS